MYIWRVEDENGTGCYSAHLIELEEMYIRHSDIGFPIYPRPIDDVGIQREIKEEEICGFINKRQALKWFTRKELKELKQYGFELKKREVKSITAHGEKQILAIPKQELINA